MNEETSLPRGWTWAKLGEVVAPVRESVQPVKFDGEPYLGMEHVEAQTMKILDVVPSSKVKSAALRFQSGDVLYGRMRPYLNKVAQPDFDGLCSPEFITFRPEWLDATLLRYFLNAPPFKNFASHINTGDRPRVNWNQLENFPFPLAPLAEQKRIALKLEALLSEIEAGVAAIERARGKVRGFRASLLRAATTGELSARWRAQNAPTQSGAALLQRIESERRAAWETVERAKRAAKAKSKRLFEDESWKTNYRAPQAPDVAALPALPESWCWASLEQLAEVQGGITKGQKYKDSEQLQMVPYLRVANVQRGVLDLSEMKEIAVRANDIEKLALKRNDILFNEGGDRDKLGRGWIWEEQLNVCIHQNHVFRARLNEPKMQAKLVSWCGNSYGQKWFLNAGKHTTNLASINMTVLRAFPIPLPPLLEQEWIVGEVERRLSLAREVEASLVAALRRASALKALVLARAFRGELCAQDEKDESAEALLERIRAARAMQPRRGRGSVSGRAQAAQGELF